MERNPLSASLLILWLHLDQFLCVTLVEPGPPSLQAQEGESTNFTCNFPSSSFCVLHWYRGGPAQSPKNLFVMTLNGGSQPEDSAIDLYASTQGFPGTCSPTQTPAWSCSGAS
uniref:Ig-like domain-containing protein n=1 Tax=Sus scrofa TaxID=9823 RepID=A0A8D1LTB3_PIG